MTRIAIVNPDKCKPTKCNQECKKYCPVVRIGKSDCVNVNPTLKIASISEELCIGCGACVKKCPFDAIQIINVPDPLLSQTIHRYGANSFKLHCLPSPRLGEVLGIVSINGLGKSTALKILAGKQIANFGKFKNSYTLQDTINHFKGSELQGYFTRLLYGELKPVIKPQYVDQIPKSKSGNVGDLCNIVKENPLYESFKNAFEIESMISKNLNDLSGGELQRFAIFISALKDWNVLMLDEPSSYLDVKQRINMAKNIRSLVSHDRYIIAVEHDLSILDYLSDSVCLLYGEAGKYGVVTLPYSVKEGINIFLDGFIRAENIRFRPYPLSFKTSNAEELEKICYSQSYPGMTKTIGEFSLKMEAGEFQTSTITVLVGENGMGKTTFMRMMAGLLPPDDGSEIPVMNVSYKPQKINPSSNVSVRTLFHSKIRDAIFNQQFVSDVINTLDINDIYDRELKTLSGGELQRVAITLCLGTPADVYLIDEPSAYLDAEQRINTARMIKRFMRNSKKTAFIVEHDFIMSTYLADQIIVFEGAPAKSCFATSPMSTIDGMNKFLKSLDVTFRRDTESFRPRINKLNSIKDAEQKLNGNFFYTED